MIKLVPCRNQWLQLRKRTETPFLGTCHKLIARVPGPTHRATILGGGTHVKLSGQRNETETKQFQNSFVSLSFRCADGLRVRCARHTVVIVVIT